MTSNSTPHKMASSEQSDPRHDENTQSSVKRFEEVGYFFKPITKIGNEVSKLYEQGRASDVHLRSFENVLLSDESIKDLLYLYPKVTKFNHLWGTVPQFYCWDHPSTAKPGMVIYLLEANSRFECLEGSHSRKVDIGKKADDYTIHLPGAYADSCTKRIFNEVNGVSSLIRY
jgi:hypothetical protein